MEPNENVFVLHEHGAASGEMIQVIDRLRKRRGFQGSTADKVLPLNEGSTSASLLPKLNRETEWGFMRRAILKGAASAALLFCGVVAQAEKYPKIAEPVSFAPTADHAGDAGALVWVNKPGSAKGNRGAGKDCARFARRCKRAPFDEPASPKCRGDARRCAKRHG